MRNIQAGTPGFMTAAAVFLLAACASAPPVQNEWTAQNNAAAVTETAPAQRPLWINQTPESAEFLYFTGMAEADSESEARNAAVKNGFAAAAGFYGNLIQSETTDHSIFIEDMGKVIAEATTYDDKTNSYANTVISEVRAVEYYTEPYRARNTRVSYKVWALCRIPRQQAEEDRANFARNISEQYTRLLDSRYDTLSAAVHSYSAVLAALEQNPLHRAVAYYDSPAGRVNLYEYLGLQLNTLADDISFAPLPSAAVEKGDTLDTTVRILAPLSAAGLDCTVNIYGMNNPSPMAKYTAGTNSSFLLRLISSRLEPGRYVVQLELPLNELSPRIRRNPSETFSLEIRPMTAAVDFIITGDVPGIGDPEKTALLQGIQQGIQNYSVPVSLNPDGSGPGVFTVTLNLRIQDPVGPANRSFVICDASIAFSRGSLILESASRRISEIDTPNMVNQTRRFIAENQEFFRNISAKLSQ
jgi:hypothetical protein